MALILLLLLVQVQMKKTNTIESVLPYSGEYSFRSDMRLSAWWLVACLTYLGVKFLIPHEFFHSMLLGGLMQNLRILVH